MNNYFLSVIYLIQLLFVLSGYNVCFAIYEGTNYFDINDSDYYTKYFKDDYINYGNITDAKGNGFLASGAFTNDGTIIISNNRVKFVDEFTNKRIIVASGADTNNIGLEVVGKLYNSTIGSISVTKGKLKLNQEAINDGCIHCQQKTIISPNIRLVNNNRFIAKNLRTTLPSKANNDAYFDNVTIKAQAIFTDAVRDTNININNHGSLSLQSGSEINSYQGNQGSELVLTLPSKDPRQTPLLQIKNTASFSSNSKVILAANKSLKYLKNNPKTIKIIAANSVIVASNVESLLYSQVYDKSMNTTQTTVQSNKLATNSMFVNIIDATTTSRNNQYIIEAQLQLVTYNATGGLATYNVKLANSLLGCELVQVKSLTKATLKPTKKSIAPSQNQQPKRMVDLTPAVTSTSTPETMAEQVVISAETTTVVAHTPETATAITTESKSNNLTPSQDSSLKASSLLATESFVVTATPDPEKMADPVVTSAEPTTAVVDTPDIATAITTESKSSNLTPSQDSSLKSSRLLATEPFVVASTPDSETMSEPAVTSAEPATAVVHTPDTATAITTESKSSNLTPLQDSSLKSSRLLATEPFVVASTPDSETMSEPAVTSAEPTTAVVHTPDTATAITTESKSSNLTPPSQDSSLKSSRLLATEPFVVASTPETETMVVAPTTVVRKIPEPLLIAATTTNIESQSSTLESPQGDSLTGTQSIDVAVTAAPETKKQQKNVIKIDLDNSGIEYSKIIEIHFNFTNEIIEKPNVAIKRIFLNNGFNLGNYNYSLYTAVANYTGKDERTKYQHKWQETLIYINADATKQKINFGLTVAYLDCDMSTVNHKNTSMHSYLGLVYAINHIDRWRISYAVVVGKTNHKNAIYKNKYTNEFSTTVVADYKFVFDKFNLNVGVNSRFIDIALAQHENNNIFINKNNKMFLGLGSFVSCSITHEIFYDTNITAEIHVGYSHIIGLANKDRITFTDPAFPSIPQKQPETNKLYTMLNFNVDYGNISYVVAINFNHSDNKYLYGGNFIAVYRF